MFMQIAIGAVGIGIVLMVGYLIIAQVKSTLTTSSTGLSAGEADRRLRRGSRRPEVVLREFRFRHARRVLPLQPILPVPLSGDPGARMGASHSRRSAPDQEDLFYRRE